MSTSVGYRDLDPRSLNSVAALLDQVQSLTVDQNDEGALLVGGRFADQVTMTQFYNNLFNATDPQLAANAPIIFASEVTLLLRTVMSRRASEIIFRDMRDKFVPAPAAVYQQFINAGWTPERIRDIITYFDAQQLQAFLQFVGGQNFRLYGPINVDEAMAILLPATAIASLQNRQLFELLYIPVIQTLTQRGKVLIPFTGPVYAFDPNSFVSEALRIADTTPEKQLVSLMLTEQILHQLMNLELFVLPLNARELLNALNTQYIVTNNPSNMGQGDGMVSTVLVTVTGVDPITIFLPSVLANNTTYTAALTQAISTQSIGQNDLDRVLVLFNPPITRDALGRANYNRILNQTGSQAILTNLYNQLIVLPIDQRANYLRSLANNATPGTSQYVIYTTLASALQGGPLPPLNNAMIVNNILGFLGVNQSNVSQTLYNQLVQLNQSDLLIIQNRLSSEFPNNPQGARNFVTTQANNTALPASLRQAYTLFSQTYVSIPPLNNLMIVNNTLGILGVNPNNVSQTLTNQLVSQSSQDLAFVQNQLATLFPNNPQGARTYVITQANNTNISSSLRQIYTLYSQTFASAPPLNNLMIVTNTLPYLGVNINNVSQTLINQLTSQSSQDLATIQDQLSTMFPNNTQGARTFVISQANNTSLPSSLRQAYVLYSQTFTSTPPLNNLMIVTNTLPYLGVDIANVPQALMNQLTSQSGQDLSTIQSQLSTMFPNNLQGARAFVISQANNTALSNSLRQAYTLYSQTFASAPSPNQQLVDTILGWLGVNPATVSTPLYSQLLGRSTTNLTRVQNQISSRPGFSPTDYTGNRNFVNNRVLTADNANIRETYALFQQTYQSTPPGNKVIIATGILDLIDVVPSTVPEQFNALVTQSSEANLTFIRGTLQSLFPNDPLGARAYVQQQASSASPEELRLTWARVANTFSSVIPDNELATLNDIFVLVGVAPNTVPDTVKNNILTLSANQTVNGQTFLEFIRSQLNAVVPATTQARRTRLEQLRNANFIPEQRAVYDAIIQQYSTNPPTRSNQQLLDQILAILGISVVQFGVANYNAIISSTDPTVNLTLQSILNSLQSSSLSGGSLFSMGSTQQLRSVILSQYQTAAMNGGTGVNLVWTPLIRALQS